MIKADGITKIYNKGKNNEFIALNNVNFEIDDNAMVSIIGTSGAGKSTLLHILSTIDDLTDGSLLIDNVDILSLSKKGKAKLRNSLIGIVIQDYALINEYNVLENVMLPLSFKRVKNKKQIAKDALATVGIEHLKNKSISKLSGGEKQRVAIARAIVTNPKYIFADEPTGNLDSDTTSNIIELFKELNRQGKTIIIVTHDANVANSCSQIIRISDGKIVNDIGVF